MKRVLYLLLILCAEPTFAAERPNFLWILSEDNSKHYLKLYDEHGAPTPNIEKMAKQGIVFEHAFSNAPVCSVARTTLITSCYAPRIGTQYHRRAAVAPMPMGLKMFPAYLHEAGYYTTNNSKTDYNAEPSQDVWDDSSKKAHWRGRKSPDQPFFHKITFAQSHESSLHFDRAFMESEKTITDPASVVLAPIYPDTPTFRYTHARYLDRIQLIDDLVGKVLTELASDGLLEDTFVFYFGDHGGVLPRSKGYAYNNGLQVPLVVRVPEKWRHLVTQTPGSRETGFVSFVDFGPTLLHLAGLPVPEGVDGRPFLGSTIRLGDRDEAFGDADRFDEKYDLVRTLRKGDFEYVRSYQPFNIDSLHNDYRYQMLAYQEWRTLFKEGQLNEVQSQFFHPRAAEALYDLASDPFETRSLAGDPAHMATLQSMREALSAKVKGMPDLSFIPESAFVAEGIANPTAYGQQHQKAIARLIDIADLQLLPFDAIDQPLREALSSSEPWERYWAWIVCSAHGTSAKGFKELAQTAAREDANLLVRVRAAEFLGLVRLEDPRPVILSALKASTSAVESNLILNSAALLHDAVLHDDFKITKADVNFSDRYIDDRLTYLSTP